MACSAKQRLGFILCFTPCSTVQQIDITAISTVAMVSLSGDKQTVIKTLEFLMKVIWPIAQNITGSIYLILT